MNGASLVVVAVVVAASVPAQVSRIDTARVAIVSGDYDEAMRLIDRYHDDFPDGALAPDADVVAMSPGRLSGSFTSRRPLRS